MSGLIRFNEEISSASKSYLAKSAFKNPFLEDCLAVDSIEVVSDESVARAEDRTHIEAGVGLLLKTVMRIPTRDGNEVPCAIVPAYSHVGVKNDFQTFHSNQAKIICERYGEEWIEKEGGRGVVFTVHNEAPQITEGYMQINKVMHADVSHTARDLPAGMNVEPLSKEEKLAMFAGYVCFPSFSNSGNLKSFALIQNDSVLCGISVYVVGNTLISTDAFITTDCPDLDGKQNLELLISHVSKSLTTKRAEIRYMQTDKLIGNALKGRASGTMISALPIGLTDNEQLALIRAPWATSGLFTF